MPGMFSGLFSSPFQYNPSMSDNDAWYFNDPDLGFDNTYNAFLGQMRPQNQGSNFFDWAQSGQGRNAAQNAFGQYEANLFRQGQGEQTPSYLDFMKGYNPTAQFGQMSARDRGENPMANNPFTRFLTR